MLKFLYRMKSRKGFTIVELIVVIAIIGVLTALVLPSLMYNGKPVKGKAMAKAFFYEIQDVVSSIKISEKTYFNALCSANGGEVIIYAVLNPSGAVDTDSHGNPRSGVISSGSGLAVTTSFASLHQVAQSGAATKDNHVFSKLMSTISSYTTTNDGMGGTLVAIFDGRGAVRAAYWLETDDPTDYAKGTVFSDNNLFDSGEYCCAYPEALSMAGRSLYIYS